MRRRLAAERRDVRGVRLRDFFHRCRRTRYMLISSAIAAQKLTALLERLRMAVQSSLLMQAQIRSAETSTQ